MSALEFLWSPDNFARRIAGEPVRLRTPTLIFFGYVGLRTAGMYLAYSALVGALPENLADDINLATLGFGLSLAVGFLLDILFWYVGTGILACANILLDGDGQYRKLLEMTGYAHLPLLVFAAGAFLFGGCYKAGIGVRPGLDFSEYRDLDLDELKDTDLEEYNRSVKGIGERIVGETRSPKFLVLEATSYFAFLWLVFLATIGNARAYRLPKGKSLLAILGMIGLYVVLYFVRQRFMPASTS